MTDQTDVVLPTDDYWHDLESTIQYTPQVIRNTPNHPTDPFAMLKPCNPPIDMFKLHEICRATDFEALK